MKTWMIIVEILAVTTVVYGFDVNRLRSFNNDLDKCIKELGGSTSQPTAEMLKCTLARDGHIFNADGGFIREGAMKTLEDTISDSAKLEQAKSIWNKCYDEAVQSGGTVNDQTMEVVECTLPIISLLDQE